MKEKADGMTRVFKSDRQWLHIRAAETDGRIADVVNWMISTICELERKGIVKRKKFRR